MTEDQLDMVEAYWSRRAASEAHHRRKGRKRTVRHVSDTRRCPWTDPRIGDLFPFDPKGQPDVTVRVVALSSSQVTCRWRSKGEVLTFKWNWHWWSKGRRKPRDRTPVDVQVDPWPGDVSPWGTVKWVVESFIILDSGRHMYRDIWGTSDPLGFSPG